MAPEDVFVLAETTAEGKPTALTEELMGLGSEIRSNVGGGLRAVVIGDRVSGAADRLACCGAEEVYLAEHPSLEEYNPETYLTVMMRILEGREGGVLLAGHTGPGEDLMPRLAFATGSGLVTDCVALKAGGGDGGILFVKPTFGGNALVSFQINTPLKMATLRARVGRPPAEAAEKGKITPVEAVECKSRLRTVERVAEEKGMRLEEAPVVVAGGRGIGGPEGFELLRKLAEILGGAVGASRPPVDSGWIPSSCQVGITGRIVAPDLYIAVAISGSSQHLSGMSEAGKIVAINQDPAAYIFKVSDYGAVGDWRKVFPAFLRRLGEAAVD